MNSLYAVCREHGVLIIFDEIITGFRWPKYSVSAWSNIRPDLICVGKAIANGMPLAAVAGSKILMDQRTYFASTTYGGEVLSLAAATATMTLLLSKKFDIERLWIAGQEFHDKFNAMADGVVSLVGYPTRGLIKGPLDHLFRQEACKAGLLFGPSFFYNFAHMQQDIQDITWSGLEGVLKRIRDGRTTFEGPLPTAPLVQKVRS